MTFARDVRNWSIADGRLGSTPIASASVAIWWLADILVLPRQGEDKNVCKWAFAVRPLFLQKADIRP
jgi:hypothetical protein